MIKLSLDKKLSSRIVDGCPARCVIQGPKERYGFGPGAEGVEVDVSGGDKDGELLAIDFVNESEVVVQELAPHPQESCSPTRVGCLFVLVHDQIGHQSGVGTVLAAGTVHSVTVCARRILAESIDGRT